MKAYEYQKEIEGIIKLAREADSSVTKFLTAYKNSNSKNASEKFKFRRFKKDCKELTKKTDKIIKFAHGLNQTANSNYFPLIVYLVNLPKLKDIFSESLPNQLKLLNRYENLRSELKKDNKLIQEELEKAINKISALNAENQKIRPLFEKGIQELRAKMSKRETETLKLEQFSEFKGKIVAKTLFSIMDQKGNIRLNLKRRNSKGKLDAKFGTEKADAIREFTRFSGQLKMFDLGYSISADLVPMIEFLMPPSKLIKKFKIKSFDEYQQLIKKKTIESLKKVFRNNPQFFYGQYGKYFSINVNLFLMLSESPLPLAFVRTQKNVLSGIRETPEELSVNIKHSSATDPRNLEIFISAEYVAQKIMQKDLKDLELTILHELTHWFTKHINQRKSAFENLFSEGIAAFSEYCADPKHALETYFSTRAVQTILFLTNRPRSVEEMEQFIEKRGSRMSYVGGLYMWLTIYAHKRKGKKGKKCFEKTINEKRLIKIADQNAIKWLRIFKNVMKPATFFKQYAEATKKMKTKPLLNESALEILTKEQR